MNISEPVTISLADQAYEIIRDEIILCQLAPGEMISEAILEERCGVARAAVRSALARLTQEGLVRSSGGKSRMVAPLSLGDIQDVFLLRRHLEPLAAKMAAGKVSESLLRVLDDACREGYTPGDLKGELRFLNANRRFHLAIADASGSFRLTRTLEQLHNEATRILYLGFRLSDRSKEWSHGHESLLEALVRPDPDEAARIALELLDNSHDEIVKAALSSPKIQAVSLA